jgi:hypothetical protein
LFAAFPLCTLKDIAKRPMDEPAHLQADRTAAFLVQGTALTASEHAHLLRCSECRNAMTEAALQQLKGTSRSATEEEQP